MRASRLLSLLLVLQARGRVTAEAMAAEFEVSVRTIYRDVDELSAAGVPVTADRGPGGGFELGFGYRTQLTGLTADEAAALPLAGLSGPAKDLGLESVMASAQRKMLASLAPGQSARASRVGRRLLLDPLDWYRRVERPPFLAEVARAVWDQRRISVRYESWTGTAAKVIEPCGLVIKAGVWYAVARRARTLRTYRVSRILEMRVLEERFEVPKGFDLAAHWSRELARFEKGLVRGRATLRVSTEALSRIERLGSSALDAVRSALPDEGGWRRVEVPIEGIDHAALELLGFGPHIEVEAPLELIARVAELARETSALYPRQKPKPALR